MTKLTMQPNDRKVHKTIVVNLSSSITTMSFDSFNLKIDSNGQPVIEGIILLDTKGTLHHLSQVKTDGLDLKIVHTSHDLHKDIKTLEKADWTQIHVSPQALGIGH